MAATLADLAVGGGLPSTVVVGVVEQLSGELISLHRTGATHGRLAPAAIAVRSRSPLRVGLCRGGGAAGCPDDGSSAAYRSPEGVGAAADWWSLGAVVRHLATGTPPFDGVDANLLRHEIALRGPTVDDVVDERLRTLCGGLLQREPAHRWSADEVLAWLSGGAPPVFDPSAEVACRPFTIVGVGCTTRKAAARVIVENWSAASDELCASPVEDRLGPWLEQFGADVDARRRLIDQVLSRPDLSADMRVLFLVRWLDHRRPPSYRGRPMLPAALAGLAADAARRPDGPPGQVVADLWLNRLLPVLADFAGGSELRAVHARWMRLARQLQAAVPSLDLPPSMSERLPDLIPWQRAVLLGLAAEPDRGNALCREASDLRRDSARDHPAIGNLPPVTDPIRAMVVMSVARLTHAAVTPVRGVRSPVTATMRRGRTVLRSVPGVRLPAALLLGALTCLGPAVMVRFPGVPVIAVLAVAVARVGRAARRMLTRRGRR